MTTLAPLVEDETFLKERAAAEELATFKNELLIKLLDNTVLEGALNIHREVLRRELSDDQLRTFVERHPRLVFAHPSTSSELRGEILVDEDMRARLLASPFFRRGKYCKACVVDSTSGRMR